MHHDVLARDLTDATGTFDQLLLRGKLLSYTVRRPLDDLILRALLRRELREDSTYRRVDRVLRDEGGMFKRHVYDICDSFCSVRDARVLVAGVGYGRSVFQLAALVPGMIVAFDLDEYPEEWTFVSNVCRSFRS